MSEIIEATKFYVKEKLKNGLIRARFFLPSPPSWTYSDGKWIGGESYRAIVDKLKVNIIYKGSPDWHRKTNIIHQNKRAVADKYLKNKTAYFSPRLFLDGKEILPKSDWKIGETPNRLEMDYGICKHILQLRHGEILDWWVFEKNPEGDVLIKSNLQKDDDIKIKKPFAISELGRIDIETKSGNKYIPKKVFDSVAYPFWIDDTVDFYSSSSDGHIDKNGSSYTDVRDASSGLINDTGEALTIGQKFISSLNIYYIYRGFLFFDTSSIPSSADITSASLHFYLSNDYSNTDFDITIQNGQPTYPHDPLEDGDYNRTHYSGNGGSLNTSNLTSGYNTIDLNSDGISWIQKSGQTKLCLRSSRDINGNAPSGNESIIFHTNEKGSGYQPYLEVVYSGETNVTVVVPDVNINSQNFIPVINTQSNISLLSPVVEGTASVISPAVSSGIGVIIFGVSPPNAAGFVFTPSILGEIYISIPVAETTVESLSPSLSAGLSILINSVNIQSEPFVPNVGTGFGTLIEPRTILASIFVSPPSISIRNIRLVINGYKFYKDESVSVLLKSFEKQIKERWTDINGKFFYIMEEKPVSITVIISVKESNFDNMMSKVEDILLSVFYDIPKPYSFLWRGQEFRVFPVSWKLKRGKFKGMSYLEIEYLKE